jgi:hypothetical protein
MRALYALYSDPDSAQDAVERLRRAGVADRKIMVISAEPFEEYEFSHRDKPTWIFWIAVAGGVLGLTFGYLLATMTERAWPIVTGGMPIVAMWPNIIVMFELTMLGTILATVVSLFVTTKLPTFESRIYDPAVSEGKIMVAVEHPMPDSIENVERTFKMSQTDQVKTIE